MPAREILLGLAHFGALQMAHFERDLLAQRRGQRQSGHEVACRSRWITWEATGAGFSPSLSQMRSSTSGPMCAKVPTAPEILPTRRSSAAASIRREIAAGLLVPDGEFQPEGNRLGVDSVGAPDLHGMLKLECAPLQYRPQFPQIVKQDLCRLCEL